MADTVDLEPFEGLIFSTAVRYAAYLDDDLDDIQQVLRIKVWQALCSFEASRSVRYAGDREKARESFVFSCLRNRVKDLLKQQYRLNDARKGGPLFVEGLDPGSFEQSMAAEDANLWEVTEGNVELPSTLDQVERALVGVLLTGDFTRAEIAMRLGVSRKRVLVLHRSVQEKLRDWAPDGFVFAARLHLELAA